MRGASAGMANCLRRKSRDMTQDPVRKKNCVGKVRCMKNCSLRFRASLKPGAASLDRPSAKNMAREVRHMAASPIQVSTVEKKFQPSSSLSAKVFESRGSRTMPIKPPARR